ncbi:hypothetical protein I7I48_00779 [Histoplasma ohiense]|nr:hypothetical protein I7I48_00779 [Histoplasma ohiense (nom. inval.)]
MKRREQDDCLWLWGHLFSGLRRRQRVQRRCTRWLWRKLMRQKRRCRFFGNPFSSFIFFFSHGSLILSFPC